jgi:capsular exopolysaccharide synthesis family protein
MNNNNQGNSEQHRLSRQAGPHAYVPHQRFEDYVQVILRGKWIIVASTVVVLALTAVYTFTTDRVYEATAVVLIDTKGQQSSIPIFDVSGIGAVKNIKNELEILKSRSLAEAVAERLLQLLYVDEAKRERVLITKPPKDNGSNDSVLSLAEVANEAKNSVRFEPIRDSDVIKVIAHSTKPEEAALIANVYAQAYYDRNMYASRTRSRAVREFLEEQLHTKKSSLDESETTLQKYMEQAGVVSLDDEAKRVIDQLSQLEAQRDATDISIQSLTKTLQSYRDELARVEEKAAQVIGEANDPYIRSLQEQMAKLEVQRDVTVVQNPSLVGQEIYNQKLREINEQIEALRTKLKKRTEEYLRTLIPGQASDPTRFVSELKQKIVETQIQLQEWQAKKKALSAVITQYEKQFESIPQKNIEFARLQRARLSNEKLYLLVEEKYNEAAIKEKSEFGYIDIIDAAIVPTNPVTPNTRLNLILGLVLGVALGLGLVFLREFLDVRVRTPEDLKKRGFATLSGVPIMDDEIRRLGGEPKVEREGKLIDAHLIAFVNPLSSVAESYRRLRTNIQYAQVDHAVRTILVTSSNPSEGKTTTVSNLAITFAQTGKKVLLMDTDLRRPGLHTAFDVEKEPGLTNVLYDNAKSEEVIHRTPIESMDLLTCGAIPPNPSETLGSQRMKDLLSHLRNIYDVILCDSPPVLAVTDPVVLATILDGVVVVVSSGHTRIDALERAVELTENVNARILGFVLNNFDLRAAYGGYYGYYRYKYYTYGYGGYGSGVYGSDNGEEGKKVRGEKR